MRTFDIPSFYRSPTVSKIKSTRQAHDPRKKDLSPTVLECGSLNVKLARFFGFCYGVENAIEIAYRAISENPGKRVFLLSEMIHNAKVNRDLEERGVRFLLSTAGEELIPFSELRPDDIVVVPAFGTTVDLFSRLRAHGVDPLLYNATCPFVEKVWKRAEKLGTQGYTVIIHGKHFHEETRATFSHALQTAATLVLRDMDEAQVISGFIRGTVSAAELLERFAGKYSDGFVPERHLLRVGVVNQTTMLASETQAISEMLKGVYLERFGPENLGEHFADTRDTLCYATEENQEAVVRLLEEPADLALVIGGYNSSNTSHLAKLLGKKFPTYHIKDAAEILSKDEIRHLNGSTREIQVTRGWVPETARPLEVVVTAGASCPDALVDEVLNRLSSLQG